MRVTSLLIGGIEYISSVLWAGFEITHDFGDRMGEAHFTVKGQPAGIDAGVLPGGTVVIYSNATVLFSGTVARIEPIAVIVGTSGTGHSNVAVSCVDNSKLLETAIITTAISYTSTADSAIIAAMFGLYLASFNLTVSTVATIDLQVAAGWTLRQLLLELSSRTGAVYYVDYAAATLSYHSATAVSAPFGIRESTAASILYDVAIYDLATYDVGGATSQIPLFGTVKNTKEWTTPANRVLVLGGLQSGGARLSVTRNDATSQGTYGILARTIVDNNILTTADANARGDVELARFSNPNISGSFSIDVDGLKVGQNLSVVLPSQMLNGSFLIRRVTMRWPNMTVTRYTVEFGDWRPDFTRNLRNSLNNPTQYPYVPIAVPASGSIVPGSFASTLQGIGLVSSLPTLPNSSYPTNSVVLLTSSPRKLYRNNAGTWTAEVPTGDLTGQITTTQITDGSITTAKVVTGAITANEIAALAVTAGKIAADAVIAGTIAAGAIRAVDAAFDAAAIQTADIADAIIQTAKIGDLQVTALKIADLTITSAKIADATITSAKIISLVADKISAGTISASVSLTSPTLVITSGTTTINLDSTNFLKLVDTSGLTFKFAVSASTVRIGRSNDSIYVQTSASGSIDFHSDSTTKVLLAGAAGTAGRLSLYDVSGVEQIRINSGFITCLEAGGNVTASLDWLSGGVLYLSTTAGVLKVTLDGVTGNVTASDFIVGSNHATLAASAGKKFTSGFAQLSSGTVTINSGLSTIDSFVCTLSTGATPAQYLEANGTAGAMVVKSSATGSADFFYWLAFGNA